MLKLCPKCNLNKESNVDFYLRSGTNCPQSYCKKCTKNLNTKESGQAYRDKHREHFKYLRRMSRDRNKETYLLKSARLRAKKYNLEFNIEKSDIIIPECCPVLGILILNGSSNKDNNPSLDRIDNNKGYIRGNILVVSYRANRLKGQSTDNERKLLVDFYVNRV